MKKRITESKNVLSSMELQIKVWRSELGQAEIELLCAPGDAMMVSLYGL